MNIENYLETQYRQLISISQLNAEYEYLYSSINNEKLKDILVTLHFNLTGLYRVMNERLPTNENGAHFWAEQSRQLIKNIEIALGLFSAMKNSKDAFEIDDYYDILLRKSRDFLKSSGGSLLPANMQKVDLYYTIPIFKSVSTITIHNVSKEFTAELLQIGSGSYANVYKYRDTFYNKTFGLKRAKKELSPKELTRFKREFEEMIELSSPYILEVYTYNENQNEYIMEFMDFTLDSYISKNNASLSDYQRKSIAQQILKAFEYIHSKNKLHRDINPKNILLKKYDDVIVVKIADFGLVKTYDSALTTINTEFKGYYNDPSLILDGFDKYNILHETFALTRVIYFVLTGKTNTENIVNANLQSFLNKGLSANKSIRFQNTSEMVEALRKI